MKAKQYVQEQVMKVSSGVAFAIFVAVGIGFLIQTLGNMTGIEMLFKIGKVTTVMLAPALGAGIAYKMEVNALVLFSAMSSATLGAGAVTILEDGSLSLVGGDPVGALIAATVAVFVGKKNYGHIKIRYDYYPNRYRANWRSCWCLVQRCDPTDTLAIKSDDFRCG